MKTNEKQFMKALGANLKKLRKSQKRSQTDLGAYLKLHQTAICRIEQGCQALTPFQIKQVLELYSVEFHELVEM